MNREYWHDPQNILAQWLRAPWYWQRLFDLCLLCGLLVMPLGQWHGLSTKQANLAQELKLATETLQQQARRYSALQQQSAMQRPSPQLASIILPINQQIESFKNTLDVTDLRWEFHAMPRLHLSLLGGFTSLQHFMELLLKEQPALQLERLALQKEDNGISIRAEIIFRLARGNHES